MNDFRVIKHNGHFFSSDQYNQLHADSLAFVESELDIKLPHLRKVVVTHHVPTYYHYPEQYRGSILADAFTVELFDLIERTKPDVWIYRHHHVNTSDFRINNTQLLTNQLGYVGYQEHLLFEPKQDGYFGQLSINLFLHNKLDEFIINIEKLIFRIILIQLLFELFH